MINKELQTIKNLEESDLDEAFKMAGLESIPYFHLLILLQQFLIKKTIIKIIHLAYLVMSIQEKDM